MQSPLLSLQGLCLVALRVCNPKPPTNLGKLKERTSTSSPTVCILQLVYSFHHFEYTLKSSHHANPWNLFKATTLRNTQQAIWWQVSSAVLQCTSSPNTRVYGFVAPLLIRWVGVGGRRPSLHFYLFAAETLLSINFPIV